VGLERGPLSPVNTTEELLWRKSSGSGLESREYGRRDPSCWPSGTLYTQKLALTSTTSGNRLVGIVHSRTEAMEFSSFLIRIISELERMRISNRCLIWGDYHIFLKVLKKTTNNIGTVRVSASTPTNRLANTTSKGHQLSQNF
jgi:hypothetical protein